MGSAGVGAWVSAGFLTGKLQGSLGRGSWGGSLGGSLGRELGGCLEELGFGTEESSWRVSLKGLGFISCGWAWG